MSHVPSQYDLFDARLLQMFMQVGICKASLCNREVHGDGGQREERLDMCNFIGDSYQLGACLTIDFSPLPGFKSIQSKLSLSGLKTSAPLPAECYSRFGSISIYIYICIPRRSAMLTSIVRAHLNPDDGRITLVKLVDQARNHLLVSLNLTNLQRTTFCVALLWIND